MCLDELVAADHRVRLIWGFAEGLDRSALCREIMAVEGGPGHPPADPRILMVLRLYAMVEGVGSAHELLRLCEQRKDNHQLCDRVGMSHKTLSDLRVCQDSMRVRASPAAAWFRCHSILDERHRQACKRVERLRADRTASRTASDGREAAGKPAEPRASTSEPEARVMKMADGGFRPANNVQFATDTKSGAVACVALRNIGSDMCKMAPMNDALAEAYGRRPGQHRANGGSAKLDDIETLARAGELTFEPVPQPRHKSRDSHPPRSDDPPVVAAWQWRMAADEA